MDQKVTLLTWEYQIHGHMHRYSALALLLYDYVLTLNEERELFWKRPLTVASVLFVWNRYMGIIIMLYGAIVAASPNPTDSTCLAWFTLEGWLGVVNSWSIELILQLRIYALYDCSRTIALVLIGGFLLRVGSIIAVLVFATIRISATAMTLGNSVWCVPLKRPQGLFLLWVIALVFETLLGVLAIGKGCKRLRLSTRWPWRASVSKQRSGAAKASRRLYDVLLRDSVVYFVAVCGIYVANLVLWFVLPAEALDMLTPYAVALPSVLGTHMMINVRNAHYKPLRHSLLSPSDLSLHIPETDAPEDEEEGVTAPGHERPRDVEEVDSDEDWR